MMVRQQRNDYKIAIYTRISRDEDGENFETIQTQKELLIEFVKQRKLGRIVRVYEDDNVSGAGFDREGIRALKHDIENRLVDLILIKDLSRLGRNNAQTLLFLDYLEDQGVRVISFDGRYDSEKDNETVGIETWFNERYIRDLSKKIRANIIHKINKGEYLGSAPYGYKKDQEKKNHLCIDESTAFIVREIFDLYKKGYGYAYISKFLNTKGYPPPSSKYGRTDVLWTPVAVQRIITGRVYTGDTIQRVSEKVSFKSKKTRRLPKNMWVITEKTHEPIIDPETFHEVQEIRKSRKKGNWQHKGDLHVFKGLLYCGKCNSSLYARKRKNRPMGYICGNYAKYGLNQCTSHYINENQLLNIVIEDVAALLENNKQNEILVSRLTGKLNRKAEKEAQIDRLRKSLEYKIKQQDSLYFDKLEGRISNELFERINIYLEDSINALRNMIKNLEVKKSCNEQSTELIIDECLSYLRKGNFTNEMAKILIKSIYVYDPGDIMPESFENNNSESGLIVIDYF